VLCAGRRASAADSQHLSDDDLAKCAELNVLEFRHLFAGLNQETRSSPDEWALDSMRAGGERAQRR
jgi:hypothetical protein